MKISIFSLKTLVFLIFSGFSNLMNAQSDKSLYNEIAHMDSILFNAYNTQDVEAMKKIFDKNLEFYHDTGGLLSYQTVISGTESMFERYKTLNTPIKRELVAGSLEVYPIKDYGAVQIGLHTFCHKENGKDDCGTFKFVHIWQKAEGAWKVTRIVSYDH